jgi:hypothetical protein
MYKNDGGPQTTCDMNIWTQDQAPFPYLEMAMERLLEILDISKPGHDHWKALA